MSAPSFSLVLEGGLTEHPLATIFGTALLSAVDLGVNVGISAFLEFLFPPYDEQKSVWWGGLEAMAEVSVHVILAGLFLQYGRRFFSTRGTLVPYGALVGVFLLRNAIRKLYALQASVLGSVYKRIGARVPAAQDKSSEAGDISTLPDQTNQIEGQ